MGLTMNRERLSLMADMLDELAGGHWSASRPGFVAPLRRRPLFMPELWIDQLDHPQGPSGCAIGFACLDNRFPGLNLNGLEPSTRAPALTPGYPPRLALGWDAVCVYFGLDDGMARWLFGASGNPQSWSQVRDWVRMVLEQADRDQARRLARRPLDDDFQAVG
jgi:hypothetical protein